MSTAEKTLREPGDEPESAVRKEKPALKVWQYEIPAKAGRDVPVGEKYGGADGGFILKMPAGARLLKVQRGAMTAVLFAVVNPQMEEERRHFYVARTNYPLPSPEPEFTGFAYVDSWQAWGVEWHLFEVTR